MDESFGSDRVEAARAELREEVEAALARGSQAQAFLDLIEDVRGEGASKGGVVRVSVDSSGMPISVVVDGFPKLGGAFIEAFRRAVQDLGAGIADRAADSYGASSVESREFLQAFGSRREMSAELEVAVRGGFDRFGCLRPEGVRRAAAGRSGDFSRRSVR